MIIGFDGSRAFSSVRTGTENYSYQLLKHLLRIDTKNHYVVFLKAGVKVALKADNVQFKTINFPRLWTQVGLASKTFTQKLDVLFVPSHTLPIIRKPGLKTVVTVHDLGSEYLPHMHQLKQRMYLSYMQKHQLKTTTKIIAVSKATKLDLEKRLEIKGDKIKVIHEGYNEDLKPSTPDILVSSLMPYFLFVGTIQPRKNLERIIKAFAKFRDTNRGIRIMGKDQRKPILHNSNPMTLVIVGSKGWMSDDIYALPKKLGIEEKVKFLGYVPDDKMAALYSNATALIFPSLFEGFGLPILEAQACGCPVLTSNISSMPEVAGKGAILVDPTKVEEITSGMIKIMDNKFRVNLVKKGFENVKKFSWEKAAKETLEVLKNV